MFQIIDGKQRLSAAIDFVKDRFITNLETANLKKLMGLPIITLTFRKHKTQIELPVGKLMTIPNPYQTNPFVCETLEQSKQNIQHLLTDLEFYLLNQQLKLTNYTGHYLTINNLDEHHLKQIEENTSFTIEMLDNSTHYKTIAFPLSDAQIQEIKNQITD